MNNNLSAVDIYMNRIFKFFVVFVPLIALCAGLTFSILKIIGYYAEVSFNGIVIFDITCAMYFIVGVFCYKTCEDENGMLKPKKVIIGKIFIVFIEAIQWNFITYLIPSADFWAYSSFFVMLVVFLLDYRFTISVDLIILVSMILSWFIKGDVLLPARDAYFVPNIILRIVCIVFSGIALSLITFIIQKLLVKELERVADYDTLTLLRNRRILSVKVAEAMKEFENNNQSLCLVMGDIDDFKNVNDSLGHACGDEVLKSIANTIVYNIKNEGIAFRYGGEEFLILLYLDKETSMQTVENIRTSVFENRLIYNENIVKVTMTFGIAEYKKGMTQEQLISIADSNLYYGKNHGKNVVID